MAVRHQLIEFICMYAIPKFDESWFTAGNCQKPIQIQRLGHFNAFAVFPWM